MARRTRPNLTGAVLVLLAFIGVWVAHTLEYARVAGTGGLRAELVGSVHVYMLPLAGLLTLLATLTGVWCWRAWLALGRRLDAARDSLARAWRGQGTAGVPAHSAAEPSGGARWLALSLMLAALQLGLYLVQENLESAVAGHGIRALAPVIGVHWLAPFIQIGVALLLSSLLFLASRCVHERTRRIEACERLVRLQIGRAHV